jgi:hypothetical protein
LVPVAQEHQKVLAVNQLVLLVLTLSLAQLPALVVAVVVQTMLAERVMADQAVAVVVTLMLLAELQLHLVKVIMVVMVELLVVLLLAVAVVVQGQQDQPHQVVAELVVMAQQVQ